MSSLEHIQKSGQEKEPMEYELENQKLKEEITLLKQSLEREQMLNAELKTHNSSLFVTGMYLDVTLLVERKKFAVHQNILSAHSPVLAAMLKRGQNEDGVVVITGINVDTFEMLLRFLYTGQVPLLERQAATELMAAAKEYQMDGLKKYLLGQLVSCLPDLCLGALFRQMTLKDQIGARKVCHRWADLVLETTSKRRKLILLLGEYSIEAFENQINLAFRYERQVQKLLLKADGSKMYSIRRLTSWNSLHLDSLDEASTEEIASTFTDTKELQVTVIKLLFISDSLAHLLEQWSRQLISLQLFEGIKDTDKKPVTTRLFAAINAQSALKHLHFHLETLEVPNLSIVSQLEELRFYAYYTFTEQFVQWLQQYGEGNQGLARISGSSPVLQCPRLLQLPFPHHHATRFAVLLSPTSLTGHRKNPLPLNALPVLGPSQSDMSTQTRRT